MYLPPMSFYHDRKFQIIVVLLAITAISFVLSMNTNSVAVVLFVLGMMALSIIAIVFGFIFLIINTIVLDLSKRTEIKRGMYSALFIMCCIAILIGFYWYADNLPNSIGFVRDGVTAGVSAIIGGLALEAILRLNPR